MPYIDYTDLKKRSLSWGDESILDFESWYELPPGDPTLVGTYQYTDSINQGWYLGWDIKDYHKKLRTGALLPHTPYQSFSQIGETSSEADIVTTSGGHTWWPTGCPFRSDWIITPEIIRAHLPTECSYLATEAAAKIYSNGFDALTFLAELKECRRMFANAANMIRHAKLPSNFRELTSEWLGARYGWRPLINEIFSINKILKGLKEELRTRYSDRSGRKYSSTSVQEFSVEYGLYWLDVTYVDTVEIGLRGSVTADIIVPDFQFNPLQTGWEVIPLSFVVDWFVNVGQCLSALSFLNIVGDYSASYGRYVKMTRVYSHEVGQYKSGLASATVSQNATCTAELFIRNPCFVNPVPRFTVRLNPWKILDLVGLITQRLH